jgi:glutamate-ammonia-ligase adenylyltransferase
VSWLARLAAGTLEPERVQTALARIEQAWPRDYPPLEGLLSSFPAGPGAMPGLLAASPVSTEKIIRDPGALVWLSQPEICASERGPVRMQLDLEEERPAGFDAEFRALRRVKNREMLRIALREVARLSPLEQTTYEIACVAEVCMREVCDGWLGEISRRWGKPGTDFCVIGMGKLGGGELNYSSDIDVMFLYGEDGVLNPSFTRQEFFTRLAEKITGTFATASPAGALFRIDIRLRPEGVSGPLVRSLESMENYYAGYGETWERMALGKARVIAGSEELFYEFSHRLQPFIYPRSISPDVLDEVAGIKRRIERDIVGEAGLTRNVKLGRGGIREIEFVAQALQLIHGARHAFLQERNTLKALRALRQLDFVAGAEMESLAAAYRFLRDVEHRLQIEHEMQTHTLPEPGPGRVALARSLGFGEEPDFDAALLVHTCAVRGIFEKFLQGGADRGGGGTGRDLAFFQDEVGAEKELVELGRPGSTGHVSPRTRKLYGRLEPLLLAALRGLADPDMALHRFVRFVERYGIRGLLFETLVTHPRLLELLLRLFDASRFLTEIVLRRPQLVEETARTGILGRELDVAAHMAGLGRREEDLAPGDWVRVYRRAQILRIALRDILGFAETGQVQREYTALAEACLLHTQRVLGLEEVLTIVAMGKFGGGELSYGCDLDVMFIGDEPGRAAELIKAMTAQTAEGILFLVDARLRPEGEAGLLAVPLESYRRYYRSRAQLWEAQALTKARPIAGPDQAAFATWAREAWGEFARREDVLPGIRRMHERVVRERGGGPGAFKTGVGGLMELEFQTQALQMRHGIWEPNTVRALDALAKAGVIAAGAAAERGGDYLFLRRCEATIRRVDNASLSTLPPDPAGKRQVAIRMGFAGTDAFLARYQAAREAIHAWCARIE